MATSGTSERIRILRVITRLNVGGPTFHVRILHDGLPRDRFEERLLAGRPAEGETEPDFVGDLAPVRIASLGREIAWSEDRRALAAIRREIKDFRPHLVHTHHGKAGLLGRFAARSEGVPTVHTYHGHTFHGYFSGIRGRLVTAAERFLARRTDAIIAQSPSQRDDLVRVLGAATAGRIAIIPPAVDFDRLDRGRAAVAPRPSGRPPTVAFIGRIVPVKRAEVVVAAVRAAANRRAERVKLLVAGSGSVADLAPFDRAVASVADRVDVERLGQVDDVAAVLDRADVLVLASANEGTPLVLIEALARGVPVVSSDVGGVRDLVGDWPLARVVNGDAAALGAAIAGFLGAPPADALRASVAAAVRIRHAPERLCRDVAALYDGLLGRR